MAKRYREQEIRNATAVNPDTGEVTDLGTLTGLVPQVPTRAKAKREVRFVMVQTRSRAAKSLMDLHLSGVEWRVVWAVADYLILETGMARVKTAELAGILGYTPRFTSRVLGRLRRRNVLIREAAGVWCFNPRIVGYGSVEGWAKRMEDAPEIDWEGP